MKTNNIIQNIENNKEKVFEKLEEDRAVEIYLFIKKEFKKSNVKDPIFQFVFIHFYQMDRAGLNNDFYEIYFDLLSKGEIDLETILKELYKVSLKRKEKYINTYQLSFATKLLHTIDNKRPIFDSKVAKMLKIKKDSSIESCCKAYDDLAKEIKNLLEDNRIQKIFADFREHFKLEKDDISDMKIFDFLLWKQSDIK